MTKVLVNKILLLAFMLAMMGMASAQILDEVLATDNISFESVSIDASGNSYYAGSFTGTPDFDPGAGVTTLTDSDDGVDIFILKLNSSGVFQWVKHIEPQPSGSASTSYYQDIDILAHSSGVYMLASTLRPYDLDPSAGTFITSNHPSALSLVSLDVNGAFNYARNIVSNDGSSSVSTSSMAIKSNLDLVITGSFGGTTDFDPGAGVQNETATTIGDPYLLTLDRNGDFSSVISFPGGTGQFTDVVLDSDDHVWVTGFQRGDMTVNGKNFPVIGTRSNFLLEFDANNVALTGEQWGSDGFESIITIDPATQDIYVSSRFSIAADFDPGSGTTSFTPNGQDFAISKFNSSGTFQWAFQKGGSGTDTPNDIEVDDQSQLHLIWTKPNSTLLDLVYQTYDAGGNLIKDESPGYGSFTDIDIEGTRMELLGTYRYASNNFDFCGGTTSLTPSGSNYEGFRAKYILERFADVPTIGATAISVYPTHSTTLSINEGNLNDAANWQWYSGSCGGTPVGSGTSITVSPNVETTYYVRAEGYSCNEDNASCASITITIDDPFLTYGSFFNLTDGATYSGNSFDFSSQSTSVRSVTFSADGFKMFLMAGDRNVYQYSLSSAFDLGSTVTHDGSPYATGMNEPRGIKFNPDGTKMYIVDNKLNQITQFSLTTPFDITSGVTLDGNRSVAAQTGSNSAWGIAFNTDGSKMLISGIVDDLIHQYTLESAYDVTASVTYDNVSFDPTNELLDPTYLTLNPDGTILYIGHYQYALATPFDISSGVTPIGPIVLTNNQNSSIHGVHFSSDGSKLYLGSDFNDSLHEYLINTGGFVETEENDGSVDGSLLVSITGDTFTNAGSTLTETTDYTVDNLPSGLTPTLTVAADGLSATLTLGGNAALHQDANDLASLTFTFENSAFTNSNAAAVIDAISASSEIGIDFTQNEPVLVYDYAYNPANFAGAGNFGILAQEGSAHGITFNNDGTKVYIVGTSNDQVFQYSLSTAYDVTTATLDGSSTSLNAQDDSPLALAFNDTGSRLFIAGGVSESILEYTLSTPYDVTSGFSYSNNSLDVSAQGYPNGLAFSTDGMKLFTTSASTDQVSQFSLTSAYNISSGATLDGSYSVLDQENTPNGIAFSESGTKMVIMGSSTQASQKYVHNYHLENAFDITSGVTPYENPVNINAYEFGPTDIAFSKNGARMFIVGYNGDEINQLDMQVGSMEESASNDGTITGSYVLQLYDELFANAGGTLTQGVDYNISNLPAGLSSSITVSADGKTGTLTASGTATSHDASDDVEGLIFTFENSAFSIGNASIVTHAISADSELSIRFIEAPSIENQTFSIAENSVNATSVGTVVASDGDGDEITFSITAGNDLGGFVIDPNTGEITVADQTDMDFETNPSFDLTVEVTDGSLTNSATITIDLTNVDEAPTDIALDQNDMDENNAVNDVIGQLTTTDEDAGETYTYTLVSGTGDTDNVSFNINGDQLRASVAFDFESKDTYSIRVQTDDGNSGLFEKAFTININDVFEAPTDINLFGTSINENNTVDTEIGTLFTTDDDGGETHTYTLVSGTGDTDNASFNILNDKLRASESFNFEVKDSYGIRIQTDDGNGGTFEEQFTITINDVPEDPTDIALSAFEITENNSINDVIGTLSSTDEDDGETFTYSLVGGTGDTGNASFNIDGDQLRASEVFDFESNNSYSIRVQTNDGNFGTFEKVFAITISNQHEAPADILLSSSDIDESSPAGTTVGNLSTTDEDIGETYTYTLISGTGDTDNASFNISGDELRSAEIFDYETKTSYSVRIQTNDGNGGLFEKAFTISINDQPPGLTGVGITSNTIDENDPIGTAVGNLYALGDEIEGVSFTFTLVSGTGDSGNGSFTIVSGQLRSSTSFDHESQDQYSIRVMADDGEGSTIEQVLLINVTDVNEAPSHVDVNENEFDEGLTSGSTLTGFFVSDEDEGDSHSFELVTGSGSDDNDKFEIQGQNLVNLETFNFESQAEYSIRVRATDDGGLSVESPISIFVNDINDDPSDIIFSSTQMDENSSSGSVVATMTTNDEDGGDTHIYSLVTGSGDTDNALFTVSGNSLELGFVPDFETKNSYAVRVQTDDSNGGTFQEAVIITINDLNEDPTDVMLSNNTVEESNQIGTLVGSLSSTDEDAGQLHSYILVSGTGDTDNSSFTISGSDLLSGEVFDYETKNSYSVRVRSEDGNGGSFEKSFTISIDDIPASITSFELSNTSINENESAGSNVGSFSTSGEDLSGSFTYALVSGLDDDDNTAFSISDDQLLTGASFDFESQSNYSIRVMVDDGTGNTDEKTFSISVNDVSEAPTDLLLSANSIVENNSIGDVIGTLSTTDEDAGESFTYNFVSGTGDTDNASFDIVGNELQAAEAFDFETQNSYSVRIETNDGNGGTFSKSFTISITNENESILVSNPIADQDLDEGFTSIEIDISGVFTDQDGDALTYEVISSDETIVTVSNSGSTLTITEIGSFGSSTVTVTADDGSGITTSDEFIVTVSNVNDAPIVANAISDQNVNEGFSSIEIDLSNTFTDEDGDALSLEASSGDETVVTVSITGTTLTVSEVGNGTATVTVTANDGNGGSVSDDLEVTVNNVNDAPVVVNPLDDQTSLVEGFDAAQINYSDVFEDEDGDALTITVTSNDETVVTVEVIANDQIQINEVGIGTATITLMADDGNGGSVSDEFIVTVSEAPNNAPIVVNPLDDQTSLVEGFGAAQINYADVFEDADGDALTINVSSSDETVVTVEVIANEQIQINEVGVGTSTITLTADDGNGGSVSDEFIVTVSEAPNNAPIVVNPLDDQTSLVERFGSAQINYSDVFEDADGDALTITVSSSDETVVTVEVIGNDQIQINEVGVGTSTITLTADDGNGGSVSDEFVVTVSEAPNNAPIVVNPLDDQTSLIEGFGAAQINYADVFEDADGDALTITVSSSDETVVTVEVIANDQIQINEVGIGTSTITLTADDGNGGSISDEFVVTVSEAPNTAPVVVNPLDDQTSLVEGFGAAQINYADVFEDADGDALTITVSSSDETVVTVEVIANDQIQINEVGIGTATITLTADDGNGGSVSDEFIVTVNEAPNTAPVVVNPLDDQMEVEEGFGAAQFSYADVFEDADGDVLTITVTSSDETVVTAEVIANDQIQINEVGIGSSTITLTANDGNGGTVSDEFIFTVNEAPLGIADVEVKIYPNPSSDFINVNTNKEVTVRLSDLNGKAIQTKSGSQLEFDIQSLTSGLYILQVSDGDRSSSYRIIKAN
ncbi:Por secretion system C-terminal sorting domain-containing protein [Ekhidna lutea]|uniref:Por secretion system C-terminal sorting domain-containing protein n=1 Tax=Ekhidna lutea TaxID=447679 RepID=A0A239II64_EKHLU|nr:cadherin domain-containing protein [Ekhidna lutea]SNS93446.1 Por secretion system C-terminal sorting domain-containing protein [Ekhidna lutea]